MLQALNTGHAGSMTTVHSNSAADALRRIETLALMADVALPHVAIRQQLASAIDMVVHLEHTPGNSAVSEIAEVVRFASQVGVRPLFALGGVAALRVAGRWRTPRPMGGSAVAYLLSVAAGALAGPPAVFVLARAERRWQSRSTA